MRYLTRYDLSVHMLDGLGRRVCRSCKAVWPCEKHPLTADGTLLVVPPTAQELERGYDHPCACGYIICACKPVESCPAPTPPQPQTDERLPPGWHAVGPERYHCEEEGRYVLKGIGIGGGWYNGAPGDYQKYPTALQAMAAALGAHVADIYDQPRPWCWHDGKAVQVGRFATADEAAWAACEHHAQWDGYA